MFGTYPISNPQHGGQKRVHAIYDMYSKEPSFTVKYCAIFFPLHYKDSSSDDIEIPRKYSSMMAENPLTGDVIIGRLTKDDETLKSRIISTITSFKPDIIEFEHPFLFIGMERILNKLGFDGKIIYSSHNIEYHMKQEMLENESYDAVETQKITEEIKKAETALIRRADLIYAVSESDIDALVEMGGNKNHIVLARNGIEKQTPDTANMTFWENYLSKHGIKKVAVFVGSAHPPNWTGFSTMIGSAVGFLSSDERILLAGSIGDYFKNNYKFKTTTDEIVFWKRVIAIGRLPENRLTALINRANCLILPIIEGGGSNLKTAEALLSGKPVVGTTHAFRAFESYLNYPTIKISNDPHQFRMFIKESLNNDQPKLNEKQVNDLDKVTWEHCLRNAIQEALKI